MSILNKARADMQRITGNENDFAVRIRIVKDTVEYGLVGIHTKHHTGFDLDGARVNSKTASVAISESQFNAVDLPVRLNNDEFSFGDATLFVPDSTGLIKSYVVQETFPDEKLGLIVLILNDYE